MWKPRIRELISNYDDDHNDNFKKKQNKTIDLMIKTTALHVHHAF